jgi:lycopene cyclase domain-containing protein
MGQWDYLALMAACVLITLPLELLFAARVYRRWKVLLASLLPVVIVFSAWDIVAIARDHWTYNPPLRHGHRPRAAAAGGARVLHRHSHLRAAQLRGRGHRAGLGEAALRPRPRGGRRR